MKLETTYHAVVGQILRKYRKDKYPELDQSKFVKEIKLGLSGSSWSRIENGETPVDIAQLHKIAAAFKVDASEILQKINDSIETLESNGYFIHYDTINKAKKFNKDNKSSGAGLAILGGVALATVATALISGVFDSSVGKIIDEAVKNNTALREFKHKKSGNLFEIKVSSSADDVITYYFKVFLKGTEILIHEPFHIQREILHEKNPQDLKTILDFVEQSVDTMVKEEIDMTIEYAARNKNN